MRPSEVARNRGAISFPGDHMDASGAAALCIAALMLSASSWYAREFGNIAAASLFAEMLAAGAFTEPLVLRLGTHFGKARFDF